MGQMSGIIVEQHFTKLSLAVYLTDEYTDGCAAGDVKVSLKDLDTVPMKNPSGYFLFLDLPDGSYTVQVNGGERYFNYGEGVTLSKLDSENPSIDINLKPTPSYPFSPGTTLIRGVVLDSQGNGVDRAEVRVKRSELKTYTTKKGEFVVYFNGLKKDDVTTVDARKLVRIKGKKVRLRIDHPDHGRKRKTLEVEECRTTTVSLTYR